MDISLNRTNKGSIINVKSIHGMLWLQIHFEAKYWDHIASDQVLIPNNDADELIFDAKKSGLVIGDLINSSSQSLKG